MILTIRPHQYKTVSYEILVNNFQEFYNFLLINKYVLDCFDSQILCKYLYSELEKGNYLTEIGSIKCEIHNFKDIKLEELHEK